MLADRALALALDELRAAQGDDVDGANEADDLECGSAAPMLFQQGTLRGEWVGSAHECCRRPTAHGVGTRFDD